MVPSTLCASGVRLPTILRSAGLPERRRFKDGRDAVRESKTALHPGFECVLTRFMSEQGMIRGIGFHAILELATRTTCCAGPKRFGRDIPYEMIVIRLRVWPRRARWKRRGKRGFVHRRGQDRRVLALAEANRPHGRVPLRVENGAPWPDSRSARGLRGVILEGCAKGGGFALARPN